MWRAMSECHRIQKHTIDEAKPLIFSSNASLFASTLDPAMSMSIPPHVGPAAAALEAELKSWRRAFSCWVYAQRDYASALLGWAQRCCGARHQDKSMMLPLGCEGNGDEASRMLRTCWRWVRGMEGVSGAQVMDGLDFFAAGIGSVCMGIAKSAEERKDQMMPLGPGGGIGEGEEVVVVQMAGRVVFAGLSVAVSALREYAAESAGKYEGVLRRCKEEEEEEEEEEGLGANAKPLNL